MLLLLECSPSTHGFQRNSRPTGVHTRLTGKPLAATPHTLTCGILKIETPGLDSRLGMILFKPSTWETAFAVVVVASAAAGTVWWFRRHRPTPEEIERARRLNLALTGRLVDGMLLDVREMPAEGRTLTLLEYSYRIGGVEYECSQEITHMGGVVDPAEVRAGFPCSVRYLPGSPQNSIVVAEEWSGLRVALSELSAGTHQVAGDAAEKSPQAS